jgi:hypothetical protein
MKFHELEPVVLLHDIPEHGLRAGDMGAIVMVYGPSAFEVEFVLASGDTQALLTLTSDDVRPVQEHDIPAMRDVT